MTAVKCCQCSSAWQSICASRDYADERSEFSRSIMRVRKQGQADLLSELDPALRLLQGKVISALINPDYRRHFIKIYI